MAGNIKGIIVEIGGDTSGLEKALSKINSASASLSRELRGINSLLKLDPSNTELLAQKQTVLKENIEKTSEKLKQLEEIQKRYLDEGKDLNTAEYRNLQREIEATKQKLAQLKAENSVWTKMGDNLVNFGTNLTKVSSKVENLGNTLTHKLTLPILAVSSAIGTTLVKYAMDFESAFTGVTKTVDGTDEQLQKIKKGIKEMAEVMPSSTTEIAAVAEAAGQLGIQTDSILDFTKVMIDLGNSTNLSAEEAASALAKFANITKMSSSDYSRLGSVIVALGNNFATTESDIVSMATRLASTGELTGLTESQIMALATAMSSVGIEAEAGGSAMSKLLKKMQVAVETGSKDLKSFAKVSGMTSKEFKQAFEKDAVKALSAFLSGLNDTTRNGKTAIGVLDDMGITEVRLSNTVLALASNSNLLSQAVDTANNAWSQNTALSDEANKRYETLASKVEMTKNHLINMAIEMGDKLTPTISKILDKVNDLIDEFSGLSEEELKNVVQTAAMVAAIGPALTILGKLGTTAGNTIVTIGNFSKAIGNVASGVKVAEGQVGTFTTILSALTSPIGLVTMGIVALTAATAIYAKKQAEEIYGLNGVAESIDKERTSWEKLKKAREEQLETSAAEIGHLENLKNELEKITDENGKVKSGYENRAKVITNELNSALGTEIKLNGNIIDNYQNMQTEIAKLISQKKAEAVLNAYQAEYSEALKKQSEATKNLVDLKQQLNEKTAALVNSTGKERAELELSISAIAHQIGEQSEQISQYGYTVQNYEALQEACVSGSAEALEEATIAMGVSWERAKTQASQSLEEQYASQQEYVNLLKSALQDAQNAHDTYQETVLKKQIETEETKLSNLRQSLDSTKTMTVNAQGELVVMQQNYDTTTINEQNRTIETRLFNLNGELSNVKNMTEKSEKDHIELQKKSDQTRILEQNQTAETMLGRLNRGLSDAETAHSNMESNVIDEQRKSSNTRLSNLDTELSDTTSKIDKNTSVQNASGMLAGRATSQFDGNNEMVQRMQDKIGDTATVENKDRSVGEGAKSLAIAADTNFNSNVHGYTWGFDLTKNIAGGLLANLPSIISAASQVAGAIASRLHHSVPDKGPLADEMDYMPDMIKNLTTTLLKASPQLENASEEVAEKIANNLNLSDFDGRINQKVINGTKTIFTTPQIIFNVQKLDDANMEACFNYVNRKFGSNY